MTLSVLPTRIELGLSDKTRRIYESFYFRGNLQNSPFSFWLKHNLIGFCDDPGVRVDNILILFNDKTKQSCVYQQSKMLTFEQYQSEVLSKKSWRQLRVEFEKGGFFELSDSHLCGMMPGQISWDLKVDFSEIVYYHFDKDWFYRGFFPKKKILTADCFMKYDGTITAPFLTCQGQFQGMNGHNWGKEHAYQYAYANCNEFSEEGRPLPDTFFDGFSAKILLGPWKSPYLSAGSLFYKGRWYDFNRVLTCWRPRVEDLTLKTYHVIFKGREYELDVMINGEGHAWATLDYDHPSRKVSQVHNTKYAKGTAKLTRLKDQQVIARLFSSSFELETLIP
ncbi:MAG: hypothetical protein A2X86_03485 [Bdellovibrionales bacterium GWA2_49_15]|nr:MAG: hypothetical protein A2X86_03485 [Bdellovibrionales bacterium GWA2_49_15]HAZ12278.1 hypothetical protein [Bdellovibrionales bacterium]